MINKPARRVARTFFYGAATFLYLRGSLALLILSGTLSLGLLISTENVVNAQNQNRVRTYSQSDVERLIREVEQSAKEFRRDFDSWLDRSPLDGQEREDRYNRHVKNLTKELSTLRSNFDKRNDWWLARSDMQRVLNAATLVNSAMSEREAARGLERQWNRLRRNINRLSEAFNLPPVGSNYAITRPVYPDQVGDVRDCPRGTFRGYTNTGEAELTITDNGVATIRSLYSNAIYSGRCASNVLYFDWGAFNLRRDGRGITTIEIGNESNRTSYQRVSGSQPGYPGYPQPIGNVPNWAVGTFHGMTNSGETELTIESNGAASARSLNTGQVFSGSYDNGVLRFDWGSFRVVREGSGIRTVDINDQRNRTSYRRID